MRLTLPIDVRLEPMNAYQWLAFTGLHEGRHAAQLEEIAGAVSK